MNTNWKDKLPLDNIQSITSVTGGDVNQAYQIDTDKKKYFLLVQPHRSKEFYTSEIAGLKHFEEAGILAPKVIASGEIDGNAYLLLNYLERGSGKQADLGKLVAKLHKNVSPNDQFGFTYPHYGSAITFDNSWTDSWKELFVKRRLDALSKALQNKNLWNRQEVKMYRHARNVISETLQKHKSEPVLLHGDLWGGNYMFLTDGSPALIDPSSVYGDRELDIGVSTVFGGFTSEFYDAYHAAYPFNEGYEQRIEFYRLYYLMIHLLKFGRLYSESVSTTLRKIIDTSQKIF